jgi:hypothetical protein
VIAIGLARATVVIDLLAGPEGHGHAVL